MKNVIYTLALLLLLVSCRSVETLVEQGKYDEAIHLATKKLAGKKKKKTKHVVALEDAYARLVQSDLNRIDYLESLAKPSHWDEIYSIYMGIRQRQDLIAPFLPLVSQDGYVAAFEIFDHTDQMKIASEHAMEYHYQNAMTSLEEGRNGDKLSARRAYHTLERIERYQYDYKDKHDLSREAYELGTTRILVNVEHAAPGYLPYGLVDHFESINVNGLNTLWKEFHSRPDESKRYDVQADLIITDVNVSPDREYIDRWESTKRIKDGWKYKRDKQGKIVLDSLGNKIKIDKFKKVTAKVKKIKRSKSASVRGDLVLNDLQTGSVEHIKNLDVCINFNDIAYQFRGDKRALEASIRNKISVPIPFPSDFDLALDAATDLKRKLTKELSRNTY